MSHWVLSICFSSGCTHSCNSGTIFRSGYCTQLKIAFLLISYNSKVHQYKYIHTSRSCSRIQNIHLSIISGCFLQMILIPRYMSLFPLKFFTFLFPLITHSISFGYSAYLFMFIFFISLFILSTFVLFSSSLRICLIIFSSNCAGKLYGLNLVDVKIYSRAFRPLIYR